MIRCFLYRSVNVRVIIKVIDKNDNEPVFEETKIIVRLFQDVRTRTVVANVKVNDFLLLSREDWD